MHVEDRRHVLGRRQSLPCADFPVCNIAANLGRHLLVQMECIISHELDKRHGDKQSITIVIGLDIRDEAVATVTGEPQAVIREARRRQRKRRVVTGIVVAALIADVVSALVAWQGGGKANTNRPNYREGRPGSPAAGPVLRGSPRALSPDQWLRTRAIVTFVIDGSALGTSGHVTIPALTQSWANKRDTCAQVAFGSPQFSSKALRTAWLANGLSVVPRTAQPAGFCSVNVPGGGATNYSPKDGSAMVLLQGLGVIDVSSMSTDSSTLAKQLTSGRTGSRTFDEAVAQRSSDPGFRRALLLLQLPTLGKTRAFNVALLHALPLIPGVVGLGHERSASGKEGVGFAAGNDQNKASVLLDPRTGRLEEVRSVPAVALDFTIGVESFWDQHTLTSTTATTSQGLKLNVIHEDPVGSQAVVSTVPEFAFPA